MTVGMAWDSSRPVPWQRLMREWVIYATIMGAIFVLFFRGSNVVGALAGVLVSGPLYLVFGGVLAKFGYQRKTLKELRATQTPRSDDTAGEPAAESPRPRPAPTSRTGGGSNRPASKRKRR